VVENQSITYYFLSSFKIENKIDCNKESNRLKMIAQSIPFTVKPVIKLLANNMMIAFMTSKNKPKVTMVTGSVRITSIGFTIKFRRLRTIATIIAVV
jgi:hypothetical protein